MEGNRVLVFSERVLGSANGMFWLAAMASSRGLWYLETFLPRPRIWLLSIVSLRQAWNAFALCTEVSAFFT